MNYFSNVKIDNLRNKTIFLDVDGTIVSDKNSDISVEVVEKLREISKQNKVYLCSNGSPKNAEKLAEMFGGEHLLCTKPFTGIFNRILGESKLKDAVVVGDKFLTDGLLAKFLGVKFIKIDHLRGERDSLLVRAHYLIDDIVWFTIPYITLARPWQWIKNLLVFAPLFFAVGILNFPLFTKTLIAFLTFCFVSSLTYAFNDILDSDIDKQHSEKKNRPIASGEISKGRASIFIFLLAVVSGLLISYVPSIIPVILFYVIINFLYSSYLKHIAVLDIILVSVFYLLRVVAGGLVTGIYVSPWIIICVFFGSLFIIVGKRKSEYGKENRRIVLNDYSIQALDFMLSISAALAVISYGIWSVTEHDSVHLVYSTLFVVFAVFRILNRIYTHPNEAESPELMVLKDRWVIASFLCWLAYVFFIFYSSI